MTDYTPKTSEKNLANSQPKHTEKNGSNTCLILQYHRVALLCHDPLQLAVEPCKFEKQMEYLAKNFNVISLDQMKQHLEKATPFRERTAVVTFDGGYTDVLYTAKEVLNRYGIFATVFAASAGIMEDRQFWWNELENFLIANHFQGQLDIDIDNRFFNWPLITERDRFRAYSDLYTILSNKTPPEQKVIVDQIAECLGLQIEELDNHRTMNAQELKEVEEDGLVTVGGHTHNYVKLSSLPQWQQVEEISKNKDVLEEVLGHSIKYFSYPFGGSDSYTTETIDILEDSGFSLACCNSYGTVSISGETGRYELPRAKVGNWNPFTFYKFLERFFN